MATGERSELQTKTTQIIIDGREKSVFLKMQIFLFPSSSCFNLGQTFKLKNHKFFQFFQTCAICARQIKKRQDTKFLRKQVVFFVILSILYYSCPVKVHFIHCYLFHSRHWRRGLTFETMEGNQPPWIFFPLLKLKKLRKCIFFNRSSIKLKCYLN